jgi:broad-specificity NMP kinase
MIIELYGLPGSGKTTFAKRLAENNGFEIIKVRNKFSLFFYNFLYLIKHPVKFAATLFYIFGNFGDKRLVYYKLMNCFFQYNARYQKALRRPRAVLDQGYFQNILSVFEKPLTDAQLQRYLKYFLLPDVLFIFDLPFEEAKKRMEERGYIPRQKMGEEYLRRLEPIVAANHTAFKKIAHNLAFKKVIINAEKSVEDVYKEAGEIIGV